MTVARSEVEFHSNSDDDSDALGIEELEREVAQQLERMPANLEIDSDPEPMMSSSLVLSQPQEKAFLLAVTFPRDPRFILLTT